MAKWSNSMGNLKSSISYLGHIVSAEDVDLDPEKIKAMLDWPPPQTSKHLRGFLGLTGFYRKFVRNYASVAFPLTELLKKDAFQWTTNPQKAFDLLKQAMMEAPVLALPNFDEPFILETDASGLGMGAVLIQHGDPICYFSKKLCPKLLHASTYVCELCAITSAVKKWRTYLLGRRFVIHTDQRSLLELMTQFVQTPEQQFYLSKLLGYSYEIVYKPGAQNRVADALSRVDDPTPQLLAITIPQWDFLLKLRKFYQEDPKFQEMFLKMQSDRQAYPDFKIMQELLSSKENYTFHTTPLINDFY